MSGQDGAGGIRVLGERVIRDGPLMRVGQLDLGLPDGDELPWDLVRLPRSASVVLTDGLDRVLLVRRFRFVQQQWGWELPGGVVEDGQDPAGTVARELEEVAAVRAGGLRRLVSFQPEPHSVDGEHVIFAGRDPERLPAAASGDGDGDGDGRAEWVPTAAVPQLITSGRIWAASALIGLLAVGARLPSARWSCRPG